MAAELENSITAGGNLFAQINKYTLKYIFDGFQ